MVIKFGKEQIELAVLMRYPDAKNFVWGEAGIGVSFDVQNRKPCEIPVSEDAYNHRIRSLEGMVDYYKGKLDQIESMYDKLLKSTYEYEEYDDDDDEEFV